MSGLGKWSLVVGLVLMAVAVACSALDLIPAAVIIGVVGLVALGMAGYDALYEWTSRLAARRQQRKTR